MPGDRIDSILPISEQLHRFRAGLVAPQGFQKGAPDRDDLARRFLDGVARRDTAGLSGLLISPAEFAWLVYPEHRYAGPPYELDPGLFWLQLQSESVEGLSKTLERYGGRPLGFLELRCGRDTLQIRPGPARAWTPCMVRFQAGDETLTRRLFGSIVERDDRFKFLTYRSE